MAARRILILGATGKQGGATISALLAKPPSFNHEILAVTRNITSPAATALAAKSNKIKLVKGDMDSCQGMFESAGGKGSIWGVYSVQLVSMGKNPAKDESGNKMDRETKQGIDLIDAAVKYGVQHFVYSSVDRGGDVVSDTTPTPVHHFATKHQIEGHLKEKCAGGAMTYTILRPVAFMGNLTPDFIGKCFAAMWANMGDVKLQLVSTRDIGFFAAQAFSQSSSVDYRNKAISLAGDQITQERGNEIFQEVIGKPMPRTFGFMGSLVQTLMSDMGVMFKWFVEERCRADIQKCQQLNPQMMDFRTWLTEESGFKK